MTYVAVALVFYVLGAMTMELAAWFGNLLKASQARDTTEVIPPPAPVTYVDAIQDTPGTTWLDQVVAALADSDELTLAHECRQRVDRALATLRALAEPDLDGNPCWCQHPPPPGKLHSRVCNTTAATIASLTAPPFARTTVAPDLSRYNQH